MSCRRGLLPRSVRFAMHPVRYSVGRATRQLTPRPVRTLQYARHPIGTATTRAGRKLRRSRFK
jgi:hypothetical protein